jgi:hypothetical protein
MSRIKSVFAVLVVAAIAGIVPLAHATTPEFPVVMAGSSALWQSLALGAYNKGNGPSTSTAISVPPMFHWTNSGQLNLQDCRNQLAGATNCNEDAATVWVVYDSASPRHIWINAKVDSVVGDRCFFARPACAVVDLASGNATWQAGGANKISSTLWGDSSVDVAVTMPGDVLSTLESATLDVINVAATDIRPEDAEWAIARVNSALGSSTFGGTASDGLDGLGYNANNASGTNEFPGLKTGTTCNHVSLADGVGSPIFSALGHTGTSTDAANVLAFNISGNDPFSCTAVGAYTVKAVGAAPIVFVTARANNPGLKNLTNASEAQLEQVFSGTNTNANAFGLPGASINAFLREPLSGTYNTTEATVMRYPWPYPEPIEGLSMETGVNPATAGGNPLNAGASCASNCRYRAIGTSEEITEVQNSNSGTGQANINTQDGIGYAFFSYGNVKAISDSTAYGYIQLNGVDPIFNSYYAGVNGTPIDPGQPTTGAGTLPGPNETTFPACENTIWGNGGFSFPNLRNGTYRSWSLLRLVYLSTQATPVGDLVTASNRYAVGDVPDYVPFAAVSLSGTTTPPCTTAVADLGLKVLRSHYDQRNGNGHILAQGCTTGGGVVAVTGCHAPANVTEFGGDVGGMIIPTAIGVLIEDKTQALQSGTPDGGLGPTTIPCPTGVTCPN